MIQSASHTNQRSTNPLPRLGEDREWKRFLVRWLGISLALHLLAVVFSQGFYHSDEHFQVLEFLGYKLGKSRASDLPVEFTEKMRPWMESWIFYGMARLWTQLGISNPFAWTLSFRALSSMLGFGSIVALALCCKHWFEDPKQRRLAVLALALLWFLPAFHARLSSENWGGAAFVLGLCLYLIKRVYVEKLPFSARDAGWCLLSGFLFGLSFEFRYQLGVMIAGAFLWLWIRARIRWSDTLFLLLGSGAAVALGTSVDAWGYGRWVIAPWNYIDFNLIRGMVGVMDKDPWWDLFRRAWTEAWPLLGFGVLASLPLAWITHPLHVLTWTHVPLFLTHAVIGHKELRFLFPMAHAAPVLLVLGWSGLARRFGSFWSKPFAKKSVSVFLRFLLGWNLLALFVTTLLPAWMPMRFLQFEWEFRQNLSSPEMVLHWKEKNPYVIAGIAMNFYRPPGVKTEQIQDYSQVTSSLSKETPYWLFYDGFTLSNDAEPLRDFCKLEFQSLPGWIEPTAQRLGISILLRHVTNWSLYRCVR